MIISMYLFVTVRSGESICGLVPKVKNNLYSNKGSPVPQITWVLRGAVPSEEG